MQRNHCWVVAFCFGTEECCVTFSFNHEPSAVKAVRIHKNVHVHANEKFPLAILLNKRNEFDSFGCEAQSRYKDLSTRDSDTWWFFKSVSNINKNTAKMTVNDAKGREFPFETLMEMLIEHIGRHLNSLLAEMGVFMSMKDALLVITTPSTWNSDAKQCIFRAIGKTSLNVRDVLFIYNAEAAAICCYYELRGRNHDVDSLNRKLLVNWEENGIDVAVIEQGFDEAFRVTFLGNKPLDPLVNAFKSWLRKEMGLQDVDVDKFDVFFRTQIHVKSKRALANWRMHLPAELVDILNNSDKLRCNRLLLTSDQVMSLFSEHIADGFELLDQYLANPQYHDITGIVFVGKCSEYPVILELLQERISEVTVPELGEVAFAKGSVLFGQYPQKLSRSIIRYDNEDVENDIHQMRFNKKVTGKGFLATVAIDFGTTYSGYAYALHSDPSKVWANKAWVADTSFLSKKTPTSVLLDKNMQFDSFGYEAEKKYKRLLADEEEDGWHLFRQFKMKLHTSEEGIDRNVKLKSIDGQEQRAMPIFSMAIGYLKREAMKLINETTDGLRDTDVLFVITVSAIWNDSAKHFMREAAVQAGIENECILLALEPEAATLWCKRKQEAIDPKGPLSKKDAHIMVVDVGGGTVDISVSQKTEKGGIKLIQKPEGGAWGGTAVDKTFLRFLDEVFGQEAIEKLRDEALVEYYELLTTFEVQKRDSNIESLALHVPTLMDITGEQNLMENINSLGFQNDIKILKKGGKRIRIGRNVIESWFRLPVENIGSLICELLHKPHLKNIDIMLLVGGFANCQLLKDEITKKVGSITSMFVPRNPELAVLKGAVRYGMNPSSVRARKMNLSYGIGKPVPYDSLKHDASMVEFDRGTNIVTLFERFVEKDEEFKTGEVVSKSFVSAMGTDLTMIKVFTSSEKNPKYIKESGCKMIGNFVIEHDARSDDKDRMFNVQFEFGKTELSVRVAMQHTGKELCTRINCL